MASGSGAGAIVGIVLLVVAAHQCSQEPSAVVDTGRPSLAVDEHAAAERADQAAADVVSGTTYVDQGAPYGCTQDCSGHDAGYAWAQDNDVSDPDDCGGDSQSFIEGCRAYGEAYQEAREEAVLEADENVDP